MKLKLIITLIIIIVSSLLARQINAQIETGSSFNKDDYYQGDVGTMTITILNNHNASTIGKSGCYLQFDWQYSSSYFESNATPDLPFGSSYAFTINFNVPQDVAVGNHTYEVVWVDKGFLYRIVTVKSGFLYIRDTYERTYYIVFNDVVNKYLKVRQIGSTANSLVEQAEDSLQSAGLLSKHGVWKEAITRLNDANELLEKANISSEETINLYNMILISIIVIAIIILGVLIYLRNRIEKESN